MKEPKNSNRKAGRLLCCSAWLDDSSLVLAEVCFKFRYSLLECKYLISMLRLKAGYISSMAILKLSHNIRVLLLKILFCGSVACSWCNCHIRAESSNRDYEK